MKGYCPSNIETFSEFFLDGHMPYEVSIENKEEAMEALIYDFEVLTTYCKVTNTWHKQIEYFGAAKYYSRVIQECYR